MTLPQLTLSLLLLSTTLLVSACNTVSGVGKDIEAGGNAIEESAEDSKK